ncbi:MAG: DUF3343 domain-containing protein [Clostridia bacterium]|nr:DUF3343 domain-containing protein [Clostridia bacterium]
MKTTTITVPSVTYAVKIKKILERKNIVAKLIKIDTDNSKEGCSYGISVSSSNFFDVVALLKQNGIEYSVYNAK